MLIDNQLDLPNSIPQLIQQQQSIIFLHITAIISNQKSYPSSQNQQSQIQFQQAISQTISNDQLTIQKSINNNLLSFKETINGMPTSQANLINRQQQQNSPHLLIQQNLTTSSNINNPNSYISPQYLLALSEHLQTVSTYYIQQNMGSISTQYKSFLQQTFKNLSNHLNLFQQDEVMVISSLISTKLDLQIFLFEKLYYLFQKQTKPLAQILKFLLLSYRQSQQNYQQLLIKERKRKVQVQNQKIQKVVQSLKKQVMIKRDYVKDLQQKIKDLQQENSSMYQKLIENAKNTISNTLIQSKVLANSSELLLGTTKLSSKLSSKLLLNSQNSSSPIKALAHQSHKKLSLKQVQQTILQIFTLKRKQQLISLKKQSMQSYIKYYFKYKFGLNDLYQEMKSNFLSALRYFLNENSHQHNQHENNQNYEKEQYMKSQKGFSPMKNSLSQNKSQHISKSDQKPLLLLFYKILHQQIDQQYFWKQYSIKGERIIKLFKRYINQKDKIQYKQLDRIYDGTGGIAGYIPNYSTNNIISNHALSKIQLNQYEGKDFLLQENDVRNILVNIYKSNTQIDTLQMIFNQLISKTLLPVSQNYWFQGNQLSQQQTILLHHYSPNTTQIKIPSKLLLNTILCYQIQLYSLRIGLITKVIKKYYQPSLQQSSTGYNYHALQNIILELQIKQQKYYPYLNKHFQQIKTKDFTYSEIVQIILTQIGWTENSKSAASSANNKKMH